MRWSPAMRRLDWLITRPIAHRGLHDAGRGIVENTASAFAAAMAGGYAIECDLQLTRDGEAVVFHDETLNRLMDASGPVGERTAGDLRALGFRQGPDRIQTLGELLDQVAGDVPLVIELKSRWDGDDALALRALTILASYRGPHALMSFDPDLIEAVRLHSPWTIRGIVADRVADPYYRILPVSRRLALRHFAHVGRTRPHFVSFDWAGLPFEPVSAIRQAGRPVLSWTIRDEAAAARARRYCDQITFEGFPA